MFFVAPLLVSTAGSIYSGFIKAELEHRRKLLEARVPLDEIYGYKVLTYGPPVMLPKCEYCGLRGAGVRCAGCGAPKP